MGIEADETLRNSPSLLNTSFYKNLTWASPTIRSYEQQMLGPMFKQHPPELGLDSTNLATIAFLQNDIYYKKQFEKVFPKDKQIYDYQHVIKAIASYERTLISFNSPYDAYKKGDKNAISASAKRGEQLFFSAELQCGKCHPYPLFTDADQENAFHNIGYFSEKDLGVFSVTKLEKDKGKFRTPTLRNINLTSPYMHDGSIEQLDNVIKYFEKPLQNAENHSFTISEMQRKDLISFLATLTDTSFSIK
jgi:cytochrome c peroxidase